MAPGSQQVFNKQELLTRTLVSCTHPKGPLLLLKHPAWHPKRSSHPEIPNSIPTVLTVGSKSLTAEGPPRGPRPGWRFSSISLHLASKQQLQLLGIRRRDGVSPNCHLHQRESHAPDVRLHGVVSPLESLGLQGRQMVTLLALARCPSAISVLLPSAVPYWYLTQLKLLWPLRCGLYLLWLWPLLTVLLSLASATAGSIQRVRVLAAWGSSFAQSGLCPAQVG